MASNLGNQYAPPKSAVADTPTEDDAELASRWSRLGAVMVDGIIAFAAFTPAWISSVSHLPPTRNPVVVWMNVLRSGPWAYLGIAVALIVLAIDLVLMSRNGQTIGKKLLKIKVVRVDGSPVSLFRVFFLRYVCNTVITVIPLVGSLYSLVDTFMIFGEKRRMAHDYIADTKVVKA